MAVSTKKIPKGRKSRLQRVPVVDRTALFKYLKRVEKRIRTPKRVPSVGYVRVSTSRQAEQGESIEEQRDAVTLYAAANGLDLVAVYEDAGISGTKDEDRRPGL